MRSTEWTRPLAVIVIACGVSACSTAPDVVATHTDKAKAVLDASLITVTQRTQCATGDYIGSARSNPGDGGVMPFESEFNFTLADIPMGEFQELLGKTQLSGISATGASFYADVDGLPDGGGKAGCAEGEFKAYLVNGKYLASPTSIPLPFVGTIQGNYLADPPRFIGTWDASLPGTQTPILRGRWSASE